MVLQTYSFFNRSKGVYQFKLSIQIWIKVLHMTAQEVLSFYVWYDGLPKYTNADAENSCKWKRNFSVNGRSQSIAHRYGPSKSAALYARITHWNTSPIKTPNCIEVPKTHTLPSSKRCSLALIRDILCLYSNQHKLMLVRQCMTLVPFLHLKTSQD